MIFEIDNKIAPISPEVIKECVELTEIFSVVLMMLCFSLAISLMNINNMK